MASVNEIILELKAENKDLNAKLQDAEKKLDKFEKSTKKSGEGMGEVFKKVKEYAAMYLGVEAIKHIIEVAGEIDSLEISFYNLASGAKGGADGLLEAMKLASKGTADDTAIMKDANSALLVLGEQIADQLPKLMEIAVATAKTTGASTEEAFSKIITAVETGSARMLRQVGLNSAKVNAYVTEYAKSLGKTKSELTQTETKQAYFNAVMKAGEEAISRTSTAGLTFGQKLQVLKARVNDVGDTTAKILTPAMENILTLWLEWTGGESKGESLLKISSWVKSFAVVLNYVAQQIELMKAHWEEFTGGITQASTALSNFAKTHDFGMFLKEYSLRMQLNRAQAIKAVDDIDAKYRKLNQDTMDGGKKRVSEHKKDLDTMKDDDEAFNKKVEQNTIKYYEYIGNFTEANVLKERQANKEILEAKINGIKDLEAIQQAYRDKQYMASIEAHNKEKQADVDLLQAKLGFKSIEYQSLQTVMNQSATLMQSKNKQLFMLGKAMSYATALMNAAQAITSIWKIWAAYPPVAAAFTAITAAATGVQIAKIQATKLPSYQRGRVPVFADGFMPSDHFPAMIGAREAVINERSTLANVGILKAMNENPGKSIGQGTTNIVNVHGSIIDKEGLNQAVVAGQKDIQRRTGTVIYKRDGVY